MTESAGRKYMQKSRPQFMGVSQQGRGLPQPPLELDYPLDATLIHLPDQQDLSIPVLDVRVAIERRATTRRYAGQPISIAELSWLLWATQGVKEVTKRPVTLRTVPSAGARHAFETFLLINRVEGVEPGLYRYIATEHALLDVQHSAELVDQFTAACGDQKMVMTSAVTFCWVAVLERMYWRYGERSYRYLHLDAGHVCQNLYLAAEPIDCGVCAIAAYDDEKLNTLLGVDGEHLFAIYLAALGKNEHGCE